MVDSVAGRYSGFVHQRMGPCFVLSTSRAERHEPFVIVNSEPGYFAPRWMVAPAHSGLGCFALGYSERAHSVRVVTGVGVVDDELVVALVGDDGEGDVVVVGSWLVARMDGSSRR